ncbi:MAG: DUF418 domain-containing protein [Rubripirellula sp.]
MIERSSLNDDLSQMTDQTNANAEAIAPTIGSERVGSLDVLRGFALLGILVMNIQSFAMVSAAYMNPTVGDRLEGLDCWIWLASHLLADQKFMTIFSILFGAGIAMIAGRQREKGLPFLGLHYRRMGWLLLIGLIHAYLFWYGDILVTYALCGMIVVWFRNLSPRLLLPLGVLSLAVPSLIMFAFQLSLPYWPEEAIRELDSGSWSPSLEMLEAERASYRGPWLGQLPHRAEAAFVMQTFLFLFQLAWRAGGLMLIGMAFWKWKILTAKRSRRFYWLLAMAGLPGALLILYGVYRNFEESWSVDYSMFQGTQFNYWGSMLVSLGYIGIVMLVCKHPPILAKLNPLAAVGRMALTNYLTQTFLCTFIFYGHGLGLFDSVSRMGQVSVVVAIWALQLVVSPLWLKHFRFGPFEWLWRSLSYWRIQPMRVR